MSFTDISNLIFIVFILVGILYGGFYISALILLWPRLIAKHFFITRNKDIKKYKVTKITLLCIQFLIFVFSFLMLYFYSEELFADVFTAVKFAGAGFFLFQVASYWFFPMVFGMTLIGPPPRALLRELSEVWELGGSLLTVPITSMLFALFVASHIVGLVIFVVGIFIIIWLREYIPKNEIFNNELDYYIGLLRSDEQNSRVMACYAIGDIGNNKAIASLNVFLNYRLNKDGTERDIVLKVLKKIGDQETLELLQKIDPKDYKITEIIDAIRKRLTKSSGGKKCQPH